MKQLSCPKILKDQTLLQDLWNVFLTDKFALKHSSEDPY